MALVGDISGSSGKSSRIGVTGSVVFAGADPDYASAFPSMGTDVAFYVSGSSGVKNSATEQGVAVFGGDLVTSGTSYFNLREPADLSKVGSNVTYFVSGNLDSNLQGGSTALSLFSGDVQISGAIRADVGAYIGGPTHQVGNFTSYGIAVFNNVGSGNSDFKAGSENKTYAIFIDASEDRVLILSGGAASSPNEAWANDITFYISGTRGGKNYGGVTTFGGDVVLSGGLVGGEGFSKDNAYWPFATDFSALPIIGNRIGIFQPSIALTAPSSWGTFGQSNDVSYGMLSLNTQQPGWGTDINFYVTGVAGSRANPAYFGGTSCFAGDLLVSGTIYNAAGSSYSVGGGGGGSPAGSDGQIQFNNNSSFGGVTPLVYYDSYNSLLVGASGHYLKLSSSNQIAITGSCFISGTSDHLSVGDTRLLFNTASDYISITNGSGEYENIRPTVGIFTNNRYEYTHLSLLYGSGSNAGGYVGNSDQSARVLFRRKLPNQAAVGQGYASYDGSALGEIQACGYDATSYVRGSQIKFVVSGTVATGRMPGKILFMTNPGDDAAEPYVETRMAVHPAGLVSIGTSGDSSSRYASKALYVEGSSQFGSTIQISGSGDVGLINPTWGHVAITDTNYTPILQIPGDASDPKMWVSGAIGGKSSGSGVATFGGDVVISGSLYTKQKHIASCKFSAAGTDRAYVRWNTTGQNATPGVNNKFVAPYGGKLIKVMVRSTVAAGSTTVSFHKNTDGNATINTTATSTAVVNMASADTTYEFEFGDSAAFSEGNILGLGVDPTDNPSDVDITVVMEFTTY